MSPVALAGDDRPAARSMSAGTSAADHDRRMARRPRPNGCAEKCKQCLLCAPFCPDSSIPVREGKRLDFDYDHCKGCGICAKVCPI